MGRACLRSQHLDAPLTQVLVWSGSVSSGSAGTSSDKNIWQRLGYSSKVIPIDEEVFKAATNKSDSQLDIASNAPEPAIFDASLKAILFGDVAGFSKLTDAQLLTFFEGVMGQLATALDQAVEGNVDSLLSINTWGDGIFVVFNDVITAAKSAWAMQDAMRDLAVPDSGERSASGSANKPQLRIGAHFGPIFEFEDPLTKRRNYFGQHVNTAARIEPIAPQGEVYVTEAFAAHLALDPRSQFQADYVGEMELAKKYGKARMYLLRERLKL
jgi:class 3 adenylate cyclase